MRDFLNHQTRPPKLPKTCYENLLGCQSFGLVQTAADVKIDSGIRSILNRWDGEKFVVNGLFLE